MASAGTIISENTSQENPANNTTNTTESICPKGWTLPNNTQMSSIGSSTGTATYVSSFSPVGGGQYINGVATDKMRAWLWGSVTHQGARRYLLRYDGSMLTNNISGYRSNGFYIRCVPKS